MNYLIHQSIGHTKLSGGLINKQINILTYRCNAVSKIDDFGPASIFQKKASESVLLRKTTGAGASDSAQERAS
jgi:hypothetical protein